jgi:hypothetical protein
MVMPLVSSAVLVDEKRGVAAAPESPRSLSDFESSVRSAIGRRELNRMRLIEQKKREEASFWNQVNRNKTLVVFALLGAILATWQLLRRH